VQLNVTDLARRHDNGDDYQGDGDYAADDEEIPAPLSAHGDDVLGQR
jgi:hypothetical protein